MGDSKVEICRAYGAMRSSNGSFNFFLFENVMQQSLIF